MSTPAFQLIGGRFADSNGFGLSDFGTDPFGGSDWAAYPLPTYHLGSDDLQQTYRKGAAEVVHTRLGAPVSVRAWTTFKRWRVNFNMIEETEISDIQDYFEARTFKLLPSGDPDISVTVRWVGREFAPDYISPGRYSLAFEIEEVL